MYLGGTAILIVVGVALDTMKQLQTQLVMRQYRGFITMNLLLYGAPGSGKGTQANMLRSHFGIPHIATGDMLRAEIAAGTPLGQEAQPILAAGHYVSDEIMIAMIANRLRQPDSTGGASSSTVSHAPSRKPRPSTT